MPAGFEVPNIVDNDEGWGPTTVPEHLEGLPYAPFGKGDKVGRISDFVQTGFNKYGGMYFCVLTGQHHLSTSTIAPVLITVLLAPGRYGQQNQQPGVAVFNFFHNEDVSLLRLLAHALVK